MFAIEQCLLCLGHHPAVWYQAAHFLESSSKILTEKGDVNAAKTLSDDAAAMFERAINGLLSKNMLLYFAYADFEEGRVKYDRVHQIYQKYLDIPDIDPTLVRNNFSDPFFKNHCNGILNKYLKIIITIIYFSI